MGGLNVVLVCVLLTSRCVRECEYISGPNFDLHLLLQVQSTEFPHIPFLPFIWLCRHGKNLQRYWGDVLIVKVVLVIANLPRSLAEADIIHVKLKRKLECKHDWLSKMVQPTVVFKVRAYCPKRIDQRILIGIPINLGTVLQRMSTTIRVVITSRKPNLFATDPTMMKYPYLIVWYGFAYKQYGHG